MKKRFFAHRLVLLVAVFSLMVIPLAALDSDQETDQQKSAEQAPADTGGFFSKVSWHLAGSILFFPEHNGVNSDPMPVLPSPGLGLSYPITNIPDGQLRLELTLDFYWASYGWDPKLGRAIPVAIENRTAQVLGFPLALQAAAYWDLTSFMTVRAYAGPTADLRIVIMAADLNEGLDDLGKIRGEVNSVRDYFWSSGRWFMPVIGAGVDFTLNDNFKLGIDMRIWAPIYRLWSGESLPAIEGWRFGPGVRITIR